MRNEKLIIECRNNKRQKCVWNERQSPKCVCWAEFQISRIVAMTAAVSLIMAMEAALNDKNVLEAFP